MNKYQRAILIKFASVIVVTIISVIALVQFKNWVSHSEAMRAMEHLGQIVLQFRKENGSIPSESYVDDIRKHLEGNVRLGGLTYRARWIGFDSTKDEILAFAERNDGLLFGGGFIVLRLDGRVEWMDKEKFKTILTKQQTPLEIQMMRK